MYFEHKNGLKTYYEEYGVKENPSLLLIHGLGADSGMWIPQKAVFASAGYHLIILDMFGHGLSSKVDNISLSDWNEQIRTLLNYLSVEKCSLLAVSMGGVIAQSFAVDYETRVKSLILSDTFCELKSVKEKIAGLSQVLGFRIFGALGRGAYIKAISSAYKADYAFRAKEYFEEIMKGADFSQIAMARKAINKIDVYEKLKALNIPSLVLVGRDFGPWFVGLNRKIAQALSAELIILSNSMDPSNLVNPQAFNEEVLSFLYNNEGHS